MLFNLVLSGLTACRSGSTTVPAPPDDPTVLMHNSFEESVGWNPASATLTAEKPTAAAGACAPRPSSPSVIPIRASWVRHIPPRFTSCAWRRKCCVHEGSTAQLVVQASASPTDDTRIFYSTLHLAAAAPKVGE